MEQLSKELIEAINKKVIESDNKGDDLYAKILLKQEKVLANNTECPIKKTEVLKKIDAVLLTNNQEQKEK